jgi:hypothetical protein
MAQRRLRLVCFVHFLKVWNLWLGRKSQHCPCAEVTFILLSDRMALDYDAPSQKLRYFTKPKYRILGWKIVHTRPFQTRLKSGQTMWQSNFTVFSVIQFKTSLGPIAIPSILDLFIIEKRVDLPVDSTFGVLD